MNVRESVLQFDCAGESLIGIVSQPAAVPLAVGIVIVVGGPQYRAGSHRQFTLLARDLRSLTGNLNQLVNTLKRNPSQIITGPRTPEFRR